MRYGRLTIIGEGGRVGGRPAALCRCDCGNERVVRLRNLEIGKTQSCGCLMRQRARENAARGHELQRTHGLSDTHEWTAWMQMKSRVKYVGTRSSERYVGRGIMVHPEWLASFEAFLRDVGKAPSRKHSIDRIDGNGHYIPGNVRWATSVEQNRNKSDNVIVEWQGRKMTLTEACETSAVPYQTVWWRIQRAGWLAERALTQPLKGTA